MRYAAILAAAALAVSVSVGTAQDFYPRATLGGDEDAMHPYDRPDQRDRDADLPPRVPAPYGFDQNRRGLGESFGLNPSYDRSGPSYGLRPRYGR